MTDWSSISASARKAGALMRRDRAAGERMFEELLATTNRDPMVLFERGKAFAALREWPLARADLARAARDFPLETYRDAARRELARLSAVPATGIQTPPRGSGETRGASDMPTGAELARAHEVFFERERRAVDFEVAVRLLDAALAGDYDLSPAVPVAMLLHSWNFAYYQDGRRFTASEFAQLERVLRDEASSLNSFRSRQIDSLTAGDEADIKRVFSILFKTVGKVGAAKVLHLWAPEFFPLWDNPIATAYGLDLRDPPTQYWAFMLRVRAGVAQLDPPPGVTPLKALDEYNYCRFTKHWL